MKVLAAGLALALGLGSAGVVEADWIIDVGADAFFEDNVGLAQRTRDVKSDVGLTTNLSVGPALTLGDRHVVSLTADVSATGFEEVRGLSNVAAGVTGAFRTKFGLGAAAPWARVWGSVARLDYDYDLRDGWRYRIGAGFGKRIGERVEVRADYTFERRKADDNRAVIRQMPGDVFDLSSHTGAVQADVRLTEALSLTGGYALREGEVVSTTRRNPSIFTASKALALDRAFGSSFVAYKIDATTHILNAGLSYALTSNASLNLGYERQIGIAAHDIEYANHVARLGVLYSW